ncbi:MAG: GreA/GreB family elongation factor [Pseudonocardia sp.]|nr:GreA/GreB family elongation factor [Pseudonocardia sp.]
MTVDTQRIWLTEPTLDRIRAELALLQTGRDGSFRGQDDPQRRELRIRHLHDLIQSAAVGHEPPDDGIAEPGMVLTVRYEATGTCESFLLADREEETTLGGDLQICSPRSPLGAALSGARPGDRGEYRIPSGETMTVTLVSAVPYRRVA